MCAVAYCTVLRGHIDKRPKGQRCSPESDYTKREKWKHQFFRRLSAANSVVRGRIWPNFKLIPALMYVIITCKYEKDPIKNNREKGATPFFQIITLSVATETSGRIWPIFKLISALMYVIITCKYEKDPIKNNREKGATPFFSNYNTICCHGNQRSDLADFQTQSSFYACPHCLQV